MCRVRSGALNMKTHQAASGGGGGEKSWVCLGNPGAGSLHLPALQHRESFGKVSQSLAWPLCLYHVPSTR